MVAKAKEKEAGFKKQPFAFLLIMQILNLEDKSCRNFFSTIYMSTTNVLNRAVPLYLEV